MMARQVFVIALAFMAVVGAFAANSSPSSAPKAFSPSTSPSSSPAGSPDSGLAFSPGVESPNEIEGPSDDSSDGPEADDPAADADYSGGDAPASEPPPADDAA